MREILGLTGRDDCLPLRHRPTEVERDGLRLAARYPGATYLLFKDGRPRVVELRKLRDGDAVAVTFDEDGHTRAVRRLGRYKLDPMFAAAERAPMPGRPEWN